MASESRSTSQLLVGRSFADLGGRLASPGQSRKGGCPGTFEDAECRDLVQLRGLYKGLGVLGGLGFWGFGVLGFWGFGVLGFWGFGVLGFWGFGVLGFGFWGFGFAVLRFCSLQFCSFGQFWSVYGFWFRVFRFRGLAGVLV